MSYLITLHVFPWKYSNNIWFTIQKLYFRIEVQDILRVNLYGLDRIHKRFICFYKVVSCYFLGGLFIEITVDFLWINSSDIGNYYSLSDLSKSLVLEEVLLESFLIQHKPPPPAYIFLFFLFGFNFYNTGFLAYNGFANLDSGLWAAD